MSIRRSLEALACAVALLTASAAGLAQSVPDSAAAERARIARERAQVEARSKAAEAACAREFAVSACLRQARAERRTSLQQLDRQRAVLDDAQRKERAAQRMARIRERQEAAAREDSKPKVEVKTRTPRVQPPEAPDASASQADSAEAQRAAKASAAASAAQVQAARRVDDTARREQKAKAHREEVEARNRERASKKPPAKPLEVPAAALPAWPADSAPR